MANDFTIRPEEIKMTAKEFTQKIQDWNAAVEELYKVYQNLNAMFEGDAKNAFAARMEADRQEYNKLSKLLQEYADALPKVADEYLNADDEASKVIKQG